MKVVDGAKEGWGTDVGGGDSAVGELAEDGQQGGLAAAPFRRLDSQISGDVAQAEDVSVQDPKSDDFRGPLWQDHEELKGVHQFVEQGFSVHGLRPGLGVRECQNRQEAGFCGWRLWGPVSARWRILRVDWG